jgi:nucleotide-binding universal stress UspA family protein
MKIMVAYDGTLQAKDVLKYGLEKARQTGGEVLAVHVFNTGMFIDYDASVDAEAAARREYELHLEEARVLLREQGSDVRTSLYSAEGDPEETVLEFAREKRAEVLLCPPRFTTKVKQSRRPFTASEFFREAAGVKVAAFSREML